MANISKTSLKIIASLIAIIIVLAAAGYYFLQPGDFPKIEIDSNDKLFFNSHPGLPIDIMGPLVLSSDILWGNYTIGVDYDAIQTVLVTPTIENLAQQFSDRYPDEIERIEATYDYIVNNVGYRDANDYYQYPFTTLQSKKANCLEASALLASILYAEGFHEVALVFTNGTNSPHTYLTVKTTIPTEPVNIVENQIKGYLGDDWIAMDPTVGLDGSTGDFRELNMAYSGHTNILSIVPVPINGCVTDYDYDYVENDPVLGNCINFQCDLLAYDQVASDIGFRFSMAHNRVPYDIHEINMTTTQDLSIQTFNFKLDIDDDFWQNYTVGQDNWYFGLEIRNN